MPEETTIEWGVQFWTVAGWRNINGGPYTEEKAKAFARRERTAPWNGDRVIRVVHRTVTTTTTDWEED